MLWKLPKQCAGGLGFTVPRGSDCEASKPEFVRPDAGDEKNRADAGKRFAVALHCLGAQGDEEFGGSGLAPKPSAELPRRGVAVTCGGGFEVKGFEVVGGETHSEIGGHVGVWARVGRVGQKRHEVRQDASDIDTDDAEGCAPGSVETTAVDRFDFSEFIQQVCQRAANVRSVDRSGLYGEGVTPSRVGVRAGILCVVINQERRSGIAFE